MKTSRSPELQPDYTSDARLRTCRWLLTAILTLLPSSVAPAEEPISAVINRHLRPLTVAPAGVANDAEFLRRVSLDLTGMPPDADTARMYLADAAPDRRQQLIDRLLSTPAHHRHLAEQLSVMLMERRTASHIPETDWGNWLTGSMRTNKSWSSLVQELLMADGEPGDGRPAAAFILNRETEPHTLARDIGRIFFGQDLQCAQCHDSPLVADFLQQDYQGLLAISSSIATFTRKIDNKDITLLRDQAGSDITFESVFAAGSPHRTGARIPGGTTLIEPFKLPADQYKVAPADGVRSVPAVHRRAWLAEMATSGNNSQFNRNAANRIWSFMFGRGLVHPLDMLHPDNHSPSPGLLEELGHRFAASGFDIRMLLREIALSEAYQRPFDLPAELQAGATVQTELLSANLQQAEQAAEQLSVLSQQRNQADEQFDLAETELIPIAAAQDKARAAVVAAADKHQKAVAEVNTADAALKKNEQLQTNLQEAVTALQRALETTAEQELTPAFESLQQRVQKTTAAAEPLQKTLTQKQEAAAPLETAWKDSIVALQNAAAGSAPLLEKMLQAESQAVTRRLAWQEQQFRVSSLQQQGELLQNLASDSQAKTQLAELNGQLQTLATQLSSAGRKVTADEQLLTAAEDQLATLQKQQQALQTEMATTQQQLERSGISGQRLAESLAAAQQATALLTSTAELAELNKRLARQVQLAQTHQQELQGRVKELETQIKAATAAGKSAESAMQTAADTLRASRASLSEMQVNHTEVQDALAAAAAERSRRAAELPDQLSAHFQLSDLRPLSPEQLCWSILRVTGVYERTQAGVIAALDQENPLSDEQRQDAAAVAARNQLIEQQTWDKLQSNRNQFISLYGAGPGQPQGDFYASADQALFTSNGSTINSWVAPAGDNTTQRVIAAESAQVAAEALYLGILTRLPSSEEVTEVEQILQQRSDRREAAQELVWALISSAEFRFNR